MPGRTPIILMEIPATDPAAGTGADDTVLLYGHLDKQPEMEGWRDGLGPWTPVLEGDRLYGRGGADDGYAAFASLAAIEAVHAAGGDHTRCVVLIEASEESGSPDLPAYVEAFADRIGTPSLVVCLDSGCIDYDRMWVTTSLRGMVAGVLSVDIVSEGLHSGDASGMVPSSFRIARRLLDRIEDPVNGEVLLPECNVDIPEGRLAEAAATAAEIGAIADHYPVRRRCRSDHRRSGRSSCSPGPGARRVSVVGADGLPPTSRAGNVLRPRHGAQALDPPPTDGRSRHALQRRAAARADRRRSVWRTGLVRRVRWAPGWNAPATAPWLDAAMAAASEARVRSTGASVR